MHKQAGVPELQLRAQRLGSCEAYHYSHELHKLGPVCGDAVPLCWRGTTAMPLMRTRSSWVYTSSADTGALRSLPDLRPEI